MVLVELIYPLRFLAVISLRTPWVQLLQQERQRGLLIGMLCHTSLGHDQLARRGPGTHHLDRVQALRALMGAAGCLAINGDLLGGQDGVDRLHPREKTRLKLLWI